MPGALALLRAGFARNLQYRLAHMFNNFGSAVFGFIYMALWQAASRGRALGPYAAHALITYIAVNQCLLWVTTFTTRGLGIGTWVRTGQIALEMHRPLPFFSRVMAEEAGHIAYNFCYRSLPLALLFAWLGDLSVQSLSIHGGIEFAAAVLIAAYTGLCLNYLVGLSAFWLTEIRFAHTLMLAVSTVASGTMVPLALMPGWAARIATQLPFASLSNVPDNIFLGVATPDIWLVPCVWVAVLTAAAIAMTAAARRKLEIQGG